MSLNLAAWAVIAIGIVALVLAGVGLIPFSLVETILSILGVGGLAGLAALINSQGYKRWITVLVGVLAILGNSFGFLSPEVVQALLILAGVSAPFTFGHAIAKTPEVGSALKKFGEK